MKLYPRRFLALALVLFLSLTGLYLMVLESILGSNLSTDEYWTRAMYDYKQHAAKKMEGPKLIVLSGSNGLFGVHSGVLEQRLEVPVINLSMHASMDISFLYLQLEEVLGQGDTVVMPLEFEYYTSDAHLSREFVFSMVAWGEDIYVRRLTWPDYFEFVRDVPKMRVLSGLLSKGNPKILRREQKDVYPGPEASVREVELNNREKGQVYFSGYSHKSLTLKADMVSTSRVQKDIRKMALGRGDPYFISEAPLSSRFLKYYGKIKKLVESKEGRLILTWPVTIRNRMLDLSLPRDQARIAAFSDQLAGEGIEIACHPAYFNLDFRLFYDTKYHLNKAGALLRTDALANCLGEVLGANAKNLVIPGWPEAIEKLRTIEANLLRQM